MLLMPYSLIAEVALVSNPYSPPETTTADSTTATTQQATARKAIILGIVSAIGYSAANLSLRGLSGRDGGLPWAIWVTAMKALPTVLVASLLLLRRRKNNQILYPTRKPIPALILGAFVMQFGGNLGFQIALGHVGLAITVPLVFAFIICSGAALGRFFLGDTVSPRTVISMVIMTGSIILLSYAATLNAPEASSTKVVVWFGIVMAVVSGLSYGINGVVIRRIARDLLPVESMLIIYSSTGLISLTTLGWFVLGPDRIAAIKLDEWFMMFSAGCFNAIAFFSITNALKLMNISQVNVINASQNAMCAIAAVLIFAEPLTTPLVLGIAMSIGGLFVLDRK